MLTDLQLKIEGFRALLHALGELNTERFISLINREPFDYTQWQKEPFKGQSLNQLNEDALNYRKEQKP